MVLGHAVAIFESGGRQVETDSVVGLVARLEVSRCMKPERGRRESRQLRSLVLCSGGLGASAPLAHRLRRARSRGASAAAQPPQNGRGRVAQPSPNRRERRVQPCRPAHACERRRGRRGGRPAPGSACPDVPWLALYHSCCSQQARLWPALLSAFTMSHTSSARGRPLPVREAPRGSQSRDRTRGRLDACLPAWEGSTCPAPRPSAVRTQCDAGNNCAGYGLGALLGKFLPS
jgi:hypothetical protein